MKTLCVIPVRGGSKGIARKNLAELFGGMSLLEWTTQQALTVFPAADVIVSTEDGELAQVAAAAGTRVAQRPKELARDESTTAAVVENVLAAEGQAGRFYDAIAVLQVTSPLREADDVRRALALMATGKFDSVVSAFRETESHPAKMYLLDGSRAVPVMPAYEARRRQDLPPVYRRNGGIFMVTRAFFEETGRLWGGRTGLVDMPRDRSIDIDEPPDLETARQYLLNRKWPARCR